MTNPGQALLSRRARVYGAALVLGALVVYLRMPTKNYYWDGVYFALNIERAPGIESYLFHPNHLIYEVVGYWLYTGAHHLGLRLRAIEVLQLLNSVLSVLATGVVYTVLFSKTRSLYLSCALSLLFAFSATWWQFSTDADAYIPSVLWMLVTFLLVLIPPKARPVSVAFTHAMAMMFHQLAVFLYPTVLFGLVLQTTASTIPRRIRTLFLYTVTATFLTLSAYWAVFVASASAHDFRRFVGWLTSRPGNAHFSLNPWSNLVDSIRSQVKLVFGGRVSSWLRFANPVTVLLTALLLIACVVLVLRVLIHGDEAGRLFRGIRPSEAELRALWRLSLVWTATYLPFLYFWRPYDTFYRLFYMAPIVFLFAVVLSHNRRLAGDVRRWRVALFVGLVALWNLVFYVYPNAHAENNPVVSLALHMNSQWPKGTTVYYGSFNPDDWYFSYFNPQTVWKHIEAERLDELDRELGVIQRQGQTAWVDITGADLLSSSPVGKRWLEVRSKDEPRFELVQGGHRIRFSQLSP